MSGIGPKLALNVLSGTSVAGFRVAVAVGDIKALSSISGVGKKTAERIVVELKDKLGSFGSGVTVGGTGMKASSLADTKLNDASLALTALGFKPSDAHEAVRAALAVLGEAVSVEALVRACLKRGA